MASTGREGSPGHRAALVAAICALLLAIAALAASSARAAGTIYWSTGGGAIQSGNVDGSGSPTTLFGGETGPAGVAIDPAANKIYWADTVNEIRVGNLDGSGTPSALFSEPDSSGGISAVPLGVAIDPAAGRLYWANFGTQLIRGGDLDDSDSAATLFFAGPTRRGWQPTTRRARSTGRTPTGRSRSETSTAAAPSPHSSTRARPCAGMGSPSTPPPARSTGGISMTSGSGTWTALGVLRPVRRRRRVLRRRAPRIRGTGTGTRGRRGPEVQEAPEEAQAPTDQSREGGHRAEALADPDEPQGHQEPDEAARLREVAPRRPRRPRRWRRC